MVDGLGCPSRKWDGPSQGATRVAQHRRVCTVCGDRGVLPHAGAVSASKRPVGRRSLAKISAAPAAPPRRPTAAEPLRLHARAPAAPPSAPSALPPSAPIDDVEHASLPHGCGRPRTGGGTHTNQHAHTTTGPGRALPPRGTAVASCGRVYVNNGEQGRAARARGGGVDGERGATPTVQFLSRNTLAAQAAVAVGTARSPS